MRDSVNINCLARPTRFDPCNLVAIVGTHTRSGRSLLEICCFKAGRHNNSWTKPLRGIR